MRVKVLHVGLRPMPRTVHFPIIQVIEVPLIDWQEPYRQASHILFTSQTAVELFRQIARPRDDLIGIGVGKKTASVAEQHGFSIQYIAKEESQEGIVPILRELEIKHLFWPRSLKARGLIRGYCNLFELPLYDVIKRPVSSLPNLEEFDEVLLTSPSTVEAFFDIFTNIPKRLKFRPIGPITALALQQRIG